MEMPQVPSGTIRTTDAVLSRRNGLIISGLAGCPIYQSWAHTIIAERIIHDLYAAEDTGFFQRQWEELKGRDRRFIDLIHDVRQNGILQGIVGWPLATKFMVYNGDHRTAIAYALGMETIPVAETLTLDPFDKAKFDLTGIYAAMDAVSGRQKPGYAYNAIRGRTSVRQSGVRLKLIFEAIMTARGRTLLDLGCADGYFGVCLAPWEFDVTFVDNTSSWLKVVEEKLLVSQSQGRIVEDDAVAFLKKTTPFSVILCTDVFDHVINHTGLDSACCFLRDLIAKAEEYLIFTPGKWARVMKHGFDQRKMYEVVRDTGKRMRYIGRDHDSPEDYCRELYCIY